MGSGDGNIGLPIHAVRGPKSFQALEDAEANGGIAALRIENKINKSIAGVADLPDDEGAGVDALPQTAANLAEGGIAGEVDLDNRPRDIGLAHSDQVLVSGGRGPGSGEERVGVLRVGDLQFSFC